MDPYQWQQQPPHISNSRSDYMQQQGHPLGMNPQRPPNSGPANVPPTSMGGGEPPQPPVPQQAYCPQQVQVSPNYGYGMYPEMPPSVYETYGAGGLGLSGGYHQGRDPRHANFGLLGMQPRTSQYQQQIDFSAFQQAQQTQWQRQEPYPVPSVPSSVYSDGQTGPQMSVPNEPPQGNVHAYPQQFTTLGSHPTPSNGANESMRPEPPYGLPGLHLNSDQPGRSSDESQDVLQNLEMLLANAGINSPDGTPEEMRNYERSRRQTGDPFAPSNYSVGGTTGSSFAAEAFSAKDSQNNVPQGSSEFLATSASARTVQNKYDDVTHHPGARMYETTIDNSRASTAPVAPLLSGAGNNKYASTSQSSQVTPKTTTSNASKCGNGKRPQKGNGKDNTRNKKGQPSSREEVSKVGDVAVKQQTRTTKPKTNAPRSTGGVHMLRISPLVTGPHEYIKVFVSGPCPPKKVLYVGLYRVGTRDAHEYITMKNQQVRPDKQGKLPPNFHVKFYMPKKFGCYEFRLFDKPVEKRNDSYNSRNDEEEDFGPPVLASIGPCRVTVTGKDLKESLEHHTQRINEVFDVLEVTSAKSLMQRLSNQQAKLDGPCLDHIQESLINSLKAGSEVPQYQPLSDSEEWTVCRFHEKLEVPIVSHRSITRAVQAATSVRGLLSQAMSAQLSRGSAPGNQEGVGIALWDCISSLYNLALFVGSLLDCITTSQVKLFEVLRRVKGVMEESSEEEETLIQLSSRLGYEPVFWTPKEKIALHVSAKCAMDDVVNNWPMWRLLNTSQQKTLSRWSAAYCFFTETFIEVGSDSSDTEISSSLSTRAATIVNSHIAMSQGILSKEDIPDLNEGFTMPKQGTVPEWVKASCLVPPEKLPKKAVELCSKLVTVLYESHRPSEEAERKRELLKKRLRDILGDLHFFKEGKLDLALDIFGSSGNGFGSNTSDVDMALTRTVLQRRSVKRRNRLLPDFDGPSDSLGMRLEDTASSEADPEDLVLTVAKCLEEHGMESVSSRATARVPIVSFVDPVSTLHCDLCAYNPLATQNTALLRQYGNSDNRIRPLIIAVKALVSYRGINDASKATLSTYGWILLVLSFLQKLQPAPAPCLQNMPKQWSGKDVSRISTTSNVLPGIPIHRLKQNQDTSQPAPLHPLSNADGKIVDGYFYHNESQTHQIKALCEKNKDSVGRLLLHFLWHYCFEFDSRRHVASIRPAPPVPADISQDKPGPKSKAVDSFEFDPEVLARYDFCYHPRLGWRSEVRKEWKADVEGWARKPTFGIEDPFETFYDVAHVLRSGTQHLLLKEMIRIYGLIATTAIHGAPPSDDKLEDSEIGKRLAQCIPADDPDKATLEALIGVLLCKREEEYSQH